MIFSLQVFSYYTCSSKKFDGGGKIGQFDGGMYKIYLRNIFTRGQRKNTTKTLELI